jgi:hypothetical protein
LEHEDECVVLMAICTLYTTMCNSEVDRTLLEVVQICPQRHLKTKRLLDNLTSSPSPILGKTIGTDDKKTNRSRLFADETANDSIAVRSSPKDRQALWDGLEATSGSGASSSNETDVAAEMACGTGGDECRQTAAGIDGSDGGGSSGLFGNDDESGNANQEEDKANDQDVEYSQPVVSALLQVLARQPAPRLVTCQVCYQVLMELVYHEHEERPCLTPDHLMLLDRYRVS